MLPRPLFAMSLPDRPHRTRVWDLPTRVFHWLLALTVVGALTTAQLGEMEWHTRFGLFAVSLLVFRLLWGVVGPRWARFASFVRGPGAVWRHVRGRTGHADRTPGHTPLGALSVVVMLLVLTAQVATGLVADDEIATAGPLARRVSSALSGNGTWWHAEIGPYLIYGLIALHLLAIVFYAVVKREPLVPAMVYGDKWLEVPAEPSRDGVAVRVTAVVLWLIGVALAGWLWRLGTMA